jgi:hypothetical protein
VAAGGQGVSDGTWPRGELAVELLREAVYGHTTRQQVLARPSRHAGQPLRDPRGHMKVAPSGDGLLVLLTKGRERGRGRLNRPVAG